MDGAGGEEADLGTLRFASPFPPSPREVWLPVAEGPGNRLLVTLTRLAIQREGLGGPSRRFCIRLGRRYPEPLPNRKALPEGLLERLVPGLSTGPGRGVTGRPLAP